MRQTPPYGLLRESAEFASRDRYMTASDQNVLREDLPLPLCLLLAGALDRNVARFQRYTESAGVLLCPHARAAASMESRATLPFMFRNWRT